MNPFNWKLVIEIAGFGDEWSYVTSSSAFLHAVGDKKTCVVAIKDFGGTFHTGKKRK